jgi:ribonuclease Z
LPSLLVRYGGHRLLIDCGEGTQRQLMRSSGLVHIHDIFITHLHGDHWLGLPGLLKTVVLHGRATPVRVYGPPGLKEALSVFGRFNASVHELDEGESVRHSGLSVQTFAVSHKRALAYGYTLTENAWAGELDAKRAQELGVTPGPDFGRLKRGETVAGVSPEQVMGASKPGRKLVVSGDTVPCANTHAAAQDADLLIHEATFASAEETLAAKSGHSTAAQAAELARTANVRVLALTHISGRYSGHELRQEARSLFANSELPNDFDVITLPLPGRGPPSLTRPSGQSASGK